MLARDAARWYQRVFARRSGRVAEGGGLENRCARKGTGGSNPSSSAADEIWRDGRAAEGTRLLSEYRAKSSIEGSNPSLSASG
jgi:hypothetical protein